MKNDEHAFRFAGEVDSFRVVTIRPQPAARHFGGLGVILPSRLFPSRVIRHRPSRCHRFAV